MEEKIKSLNKALNEQVDRFIEKEIEKIANEKTKQNVVKGLQDLSQGVRDIFL